MEKEEKIRIAITAGVMGVILLILILYLAITWKKDESGKNKVTDEVTIASTELSTNSESVSANDEDAANKEDRDAANADTAADAATSATSENIQNLNKKESISGNSFYETTVPVLKKDYRGLSFNTMSQLEEMAGYWKDGNQAAIRDLAKLDRFEAMSAKLSGTNDFYYFGDKNSQGKPEGFGVAVYASNQYYFGEWVNGKRQGKGTWYSFYPEYNTYVVKEHMYSGEFADDLPNGEGQEHYDYNQELMNGEDLYLQNAIGNFTAGLYNGEMYIITVDETFSTKEWLGTCKNGEWIQVLNSYKDQAGRTAVLSERENSENHIWMVEKKLTDNGILGMISGGNIKNE
ncbi:hypothetical protein [Butyrivibrio sp. YAB3001]|uniref:hypothetical protein n=1 Tax=Butyrivibrio sp. YAB3001 TaxID=1520812 RepID=UPI0008F6494B|nr:hypothetical protein [Butyrivibrio sp. YAB3001]SFD02553.1 MORN repeat-containing protein [Butyrivibrio sp. YAB3001]